jgi:hypothetical protein
MRGEAHAGEVFRRRIDDLYRSCFSASCAALIREEADMKRGSGSQVDEVSADERAGSGG